MAAPAAKPAADLTPEGRRTLKQIALAARQRTLHRRRLARYQPAITMSVAIENPMLCIETALSNTTAELGSL
jgi:hypothetical protein